MVEEMKKSANSSFSGSMEGAELITFREWRKQNNQFPDPILDEVDSAYYYFYSIGLGGLGLTTYKPLPEEGLNIFKRFHNVFTLAYRRFIDIEKAIAQAREARIEAALEKVRSRTMGMQKSDELKDVIRVVYEQFVHLNILVEHSGFIMDYKARDDMHIWLADQHEVPFQITIPYFDSPHWNSFIEAKEKGIDFFANHLTFEEKNKFYKVLFKLFPVPDEAKEYYLSCPGLAISTVLLENVSLYIENFSGIPYTDEENKTLMRFGKVFQQTYTRFLDLQNAETQVRESQIEAALEKVRSKAMAMHSSEDLSETIVAFYHELESLNIKPRRCGVGIVNKETRDVELSSMNSTQQGKSMEIIGRIKLAGHPVLSGVWENWMLQKEYRPVLRGKEINDYYSFLSPQIEYPDYSHDAVQYGYYFFFQEGGTYVWTEEELSEDILKIYRRFTSVLSLTYKRYKELKEAEAQAREAKIEASLERVRSKAMAMHGPNDLSETVGVFFKELRSLNVLPWRCGVGQINEETKTTFLTTTSNTINGESFEVSGTLQQEGHPVLDGIFEHWKMQKEYYPVLRGDDISKYYEIIKPQIAYPKYPLDAVQYGHFIFIKEGFVFAWTENKLSEEELGIFRRFASVLSLTYRRYLDLKYAEAQNKIIRAENERKTKELEDARQLQLAMLPRELPKISNLDIAVYMKTATEVGGDYYDFNVQENGVLNIGIGDATGHGLQAGTMITLMKGFFTSDVAKFNPKKFLEHCNGMIRDIKLGRILMSFSHLRFENNGLLISSAGMPPIYYYHKKNNRTEEIIIQGLPLGAMGSVSYKLVEKELNSGDTILLLTDGLPEQMNSHKVIFDYSRVLKYFDEIAENTPNEIINCLVQKADEWMDGQKQSDDITFVVMKVK
jgi:hemoglobin-like flavoprotein